MKRETEERLTRIKAEIERLEDLQSMVDPLLKPDTYSKLTTQLLVKYKERDKILEESKSWFGRIDPNTVANGLLSGIFGGATTWLVLNYESKVGPVTSKAFNSVFGNIFKNRRV